MKDGSIDAMFWSGGLPTGGITDLFVSQRDNVKFLDVTVTLPKLQDINPIYEEGVIPASTYQTPADVPTVVVPNVLLVKNDMDGNTACVLTKALFDHKAELVKVNKAADGISLDTARDRPCPSRCIRVPSGLLTTSARRTDRRRRGAGPGERSDGTGLRLRGRETGQAADRLGAPPGDRRLCPDRTVRAVSSLLPTRARQPGFADPVSGGGASADAAVLPIRCAASPQEDGCTERGAAGRARRSFDWLLAAVGTGGLPVPRAAIPNRRWRWGIRRIPEQAEHTRGGGRRRRHDRRAAGPGGLQAHHGCGVADRVSARARLRLLRRLPAAGCGDRARRSRLGADRQRVVHAVDGPVRGAAGRRGDLHRVVHHLRGGARGIRRQQVLHRSFVLRIPVAHARHRAGR